MGGGGGGGGGGEPGGKFKVKLNSVGKNVN